MCIPFSNGRGGVAIRTAAVHISSVAMFIRTAALHTSSVAMFIRTAALHTSSVAMLIRTAALHISSVEMAYSQNFNLIPKVIYNYPVLVQYTGPCSRYRI